jgi:molecular chaperone HscB
VPSPKPVDVQRQAFIFDHMQNHFQLFQLPVVFAVDTAALEKAYHSVQSQAHPDKFAHATGAEKRVAMQWATRANEAYKTLKNPLKRAAYLCELHGVDLEVESNTAMPTAFLMQQMEWREALDDAKAAKSVSALDALEKELRAARKEEIDHVAVQLEAQDFKEAGKTIRKLMFLEKFGEEIGDAFAILDI